MSHMPKIISLAAALLVFVGGVSLAAQPDPTKQISPHQLQQQLKQQLNPCLPSVTKPCPDLIPLSSTAGQEPKFGVMNTGQANATGEFWITVNCAPVNFQTQGNCMLNTSNDPMADPNTNKFKVSGGVEMGGVPKAKWFGLGNIPGAAGPYSWPKGGWKFKVTVDSTSQVNESNEGNNSGQWYTWTK